MILIAAPRFDQATEITSKYSEDVFSHAKEKGWDVKYLSDSDATPEKIQDFLEEADEGFFFLNHGDYKKLIGQDGDPAVTLENADLLSDLITDVFACRSARDLGPEAIEEECRAYIGYDEVAFAVDDPEWKEILTKSMIELLDGKDVEEAYEEQKGEMEKYCGQSKCFWRGLWQKIAGKPGVPLTREMMCWNLAHFTIVEGSDTDARLS